MLELEIKKIEPVNKWSTLQNGQKKRTDDRRDARALQKLHPENIGALSVLSTPAPTGDYPAYFAKSSLHQMTLGE